MKNSISKFLQFYTQYIYFLNDKLFYFPLILNEGCDIYSFCYRKSPIDIQPVKNSPIVPKGKQTSISDRSIYQYFVRFLFSVASEEYNSWYWKDNKPFNYTYWGDGQPTHISTCALGGLNSTMDMTQHQKQLSFP